MKKFIAIAFAFLAVSKAQAAGWDGCYQLVTTGVMYPAICFDGSAEEGINGANTRLFVFRTNTNVLDVCALGTITKMNNKELVFEKNGIKEVVLSNFDGKVADADVDGFSSRVKAVRLSDKDYAQLMKNANYNACR